MGSNAGLTHIRQLCNLGLGSEAVMPALLRSVRQLVRADSAAFFWVDETGEMTNMYAERMLPPELMRRYFERYYASPDHAFSRRMRGLAAKNEFVSESTADGIESTHYYEQILRPIDAYRFLVAIVHDNGRLLGQISLYRGRRGPRFAAVDRQALEAASRYFSHCFTTTRKRAKERNDAFRNSDEEALVVASTAGEIANASYRAYALLAHASGEPINRQTMAGTVDRASRDLLKKLAGRLQQSPVLIDSPPSLIVDNNWGRFRLRAYGLSQYEMGVLIQRQEHLLVRIADAMLELPLSAQQREVALLLAQGLTNGGIATTMGVSINTASYHVKQLFAKLDAHDRTEAIARILEGHSSRND